MSLLLRLFGIADKHDVPYPKDSLKGLAARWVQWGASTDIVRNPIADKTGEFAATKQPDDVWFLAGCFGGKVIRQCTIPTNRKIFFPVFNLWMKKGANAPDLSKIYGYLTVDKKRVESNKAFTDTFFDVKGVMGNPVTNSVFKHSMVVGGLWASIDPLPEGKHIINFRGGDGKGFDLDVTYYIMIKDEE